LDYGTLPPNDLFISCLRGGDERAWAEFLRRFQPLVLGIIIRIATHWSENSPQTIEELLQETYLKLCADRETILRSFQPLRPESVFGYLKVFAANLAQDHFKAVHAKKRGGAFKIESSESTSAADGCPDVRSDRYQMEHAILVREIETILGELVAGQNADRDKLIFWLYYRSGLTANSIASIPHIGLTVKGVESTLQRLTSLLRDHVCRPMAIGPNSGMPGKGNPVGDSL
jgi:RNA polymerase sigma-70 factor (ECF subfamily)